LPDDQTETEKNRKEAGGVSPGRTGERRWTSSLLNGTSYWPAVIEHWKMKRDDMVG
jgi:hypothetical protein